MTRSRKAATRLFVAIGAVALVFAGSAIAFGQSDDCGDHACAFAGSNDSGDGSNDTGATFVQDDGGSATVDNGSGAVVVHADGGDPTVDNNSGAVLAQADGGNPSVVNDSGAVVVEANGGSPSVVNDSGAVLVEDEGRVFNPSVRTPVFVPHRPVVERFFAAQRGARLPTTGAPVNTVFVMALATLGFGVMLLASGRVARRFATAQPAPIASNVTAMRASVLF